MVEQCAPRGASSVLFERARRVIPGGVNSPVRAYQSVGGDPLFIQRGEGAYVFDVEGRRYVDYVASWGPMIVGHCHPKVVEAITRAAQQGTSFGAPTVSEIELAEKIRQAFPMMEQLRMVSSGTEATMSAIRLARAATGRQRIIKFEGCYHGHSDGLLVQAGSGLVKTGVPTSPGVPGAVAELTLTARYNDLDSVRQLMAQWGAEVACIIVEPVAGNMGCVPPVDGFLQGLRQVCDDHGSLLIMDEVMTGFRVAHGGAQQRFGVTGDLVTLGKIIGGGLPVGAFGGRADLMALLAPNGQVYQAGTLSGNPLAMSAGIATLNLIAEEGFYSRLEESAAYLEAGLRSAVAQCSVPTCLQRVGAMFCLYFCEGPVTDFTTARQSNSADFARYFHAMLTQGIYLGPAPLESSFLGAAHSREDLDRTIDAAHRACAALNG